MDEMRAGLKRGFTPPRVTMEGRDSSITAVTEATPEASLLYTPFKEMPGMTPEKQQALRSEAVKVISEQVQPAYRELLSFMHTEYVPGMRTSLAAEDLPDGKAYYRAKIRPFTTLDMDPPKSTSSDSPRWRVCTSRWRRPCARPALRATSARSSVPARRPALLRQNA